MPAGVIPSSGSTVTASAQVIYQRRFVIRNQLHSTIVAGDDKFAPTIRLAGLPSIRVTIFLYPEYETGLGTYVARNYISWRVLGVLPPEMPVVYSVVAPSTTFTPLTSIQLLPVGVPISYDFPTGGIQDIGFSFDTSAGTPAANQGADQILYSVSAAL